MNSFEQCLVANMGSFDLDLPAETVSRLGEYYSLLTRWNDRLHLVAPCTPEEFAVRHILESLMLLKHLPTNARVADIGSGGGLPIIPCLIARPDLHATLIESSQKKSVFLREATRQFQATIIARPFEQVDPPPVDLAPEIVLPDVVPDLPHRFAAGQDLSPGDPGERLARDHGIHERAGSILRHLLVLL